MKVFSVAGGWWEEPRGPFYYGETLTVYGGDTYCDKCDWDGTRRSRPGLCVVINIPEWREERGVRVWESPIVLVMMHNPAALLDLIMTPLCWRPYNSPLLAGWEDKQNSQSILCSCFFIFYKWVETLKWNFVWRF